MIIIFDFSPFTKKKQCQKINSMYIWIEWRRKKSRSICAKPNRQKKNITETLRQLRRMSRNKRNTKTLKNERSHSRTHKHVRVHTKKVHIWLKKNWIIVQRLLFSLLYYNHWLFVFMWPPFAGKVRSQHCFGSSVFFFFIFFTSGWFVRASICEMTFNNEKKKQSNGSRSNMTAKRIWPIYNMKKRSRCVQETGKICADLVNKRGVNIISGH